MSSVALHQALHVLNFGTSVVKPLAITVKKAVEKFLNRKVNKYALCSNAPPMAHLEL
jgi:hypothetical protein